MTEIAIAIAPKLNKIEIKDYICGEQLLKLISYKTGLKIEVHTNFYNLPPKNYNIQKSHLFSCNFFHFLHILLYTGTYAISVTFHNSGQGALGMPVARSYQVDFEGISEKHRETLARVGVPSPLRWMRGNNLP